MIRHPAVVDQILQGGEADTRHITKFQIGDRGREWVADRRHAPGEIEERDPFEAGQSEQRVDLLSLG